MNELSCSFDKSNYGRLYDKHEVIFTYTGQGVPKQADNGLQS